MLIGEGERVLEDRLKSCKFANIFITVSEKIVEGPKGGNNASVL